MSKTLRTVLAGIVSLATMAAYQPLQAQTTFDPLFFCGVAGGGQLQTTQGSQYTFPATETPSLASVLAHPAWISSDYGFSAAGANDNFTSLGGAAFPTVTEPGVLAGTLEIRNGATVVGTQEMYVVIFSTAEHRDAFIYYAQQLETAATDADYLYFSALANYEFWMGQENEGLARYSYYTGLAPYFRDIASDPQQGMYEYWYNIGLGSYYYYVGMGDQESADFAFAYYHQLASEAREPKVKHTKEEKVAPPEEKIPAE